MNILYFSLIALPFIAAILLGFWKLFAKAGEDGWKALVPIYGAVTHIKIVGRPWWWIFYLLIPIVNIFVGIGLLIDLLKCYGKVKFYQHAAAILIPFIYLPYMGFKEDVKYIGTVDELPEHKKSTVREWADAIIFAVAAATIIRALIMEAFTIPTPSMEKSLLVGDFLFVSKFHYGTRTPATPLQVPLTHQKIWLTDVPSYLDWIQLPQYRLPGFTEVKRNDVVVFNVPPKRLNEGIDYPVDLKTNYIKRCVALPGDVLKIEGKQVIVNGKASDNPEQMQFAHLVVSNNVLSQRVLEKFDIPEVQVVGTNPDALQLLYLTDEQVAELREQSFVKEVTPASNNPYRRYEPYEKGELDQGIFPNDPELFPWNSDWYGPITVPKQGATIQINRETLATYGDAITLYDQNENAEIKDEKLFINGSEVSDYTFKQNYYFMMGDNRHNSLDSRYWGFVPEDHIVGKGFFIWLSLDPNAGLFSKVRWSRFFNLIE